jgi:NADPH:quinone reductase-like Zn-dependent oxidoreductase
MSEAACVGTSYLTAYLGLVEAANVQAGEWVLVTGARGGVGSSVIQLALWKGARVIAVDRGARGREPLRQFGIEVVLNSDTDDIVRSVKELVGREGVNVAFDCVGGPLFETCLKTLGQLGRQVNITSLGERRVSFDLVDFYHRRLAIYGVDSRPYDTVACARILRELTPAFESGKLKPPHISGVHTLEQFASAYQLVDSGQARGKVVFMV